MGFPYERLVSFGLVDSLSIILLAIEYGLQLTRTFGNVVRFFLNLCVIDRGLLGEGDGVFRIVTCILKGGGSCFSSLLKSSSLIS